MVHARLLWSARTVRKQEAALSWYEGFLRLTEDQEETVVSKVMNNSTGDFQTCCRFRLILRADIESQPTPSQRTYYQLGRDSERSFRNFRCIKNKVSSCENCGCSNETFELKLNWTSVPPHRFAGYAGTMCQMFW